jgi:Tol biopolymer transport system component
VPLAVLRAISSKRGTGSKAAQLTSLAGTAIYGPNWSPDGQNIAYTAVQKGMKEDIYSISAKWGNSPALDDPPGRGQVALLVA